MSDTIFIGGGGPEYGEKQGLILKYANRHGLVAGATGTGKTVTLQIMAEGFSSVGVPVFLADVTGRPSHEAREALGKLRYFSNPIVLALNKADTLPNDLEALPFVETYRALLGEAAAS